ncbi:BBA14 family lipoprotein [Borreliella turdi]|nr:BBA14 family lipoprotein [Borreliella turdi]
MLKAQIEYYKSYIDKTKSIVFNCGIRFILFLKLIYFSLITLN